MQRTLPYVQPYSRVNGPVVSTRPRVSFERLVPDAVPSPSSPTHPLAPQSILLVSVEPEHLSINASWLVGSGGTILLDMVVLFQVRLPSSPDRRTLMMVSQFWWYAKARKEGAIFISESAGREE